MQMSSQPLPFTFWMHRMENHHLQFSAAIHFLYVMISLYKHKLSKSSGKDACFKEVSKERDVVFLWLVWFVFLWSVFHIRTPLWTSGSYWVNVMVLFTAFYGHFKCSDGKGGAASSEDLVGRGSGVELWRTPASPFGPAQWSKCFPSHYCGLTLYKTLYYSKGHLFQPPLDPQDYKTVLHLEEIH